MAAVSRCLIVPGTPSQRLILDRARGKRRRRWGWGSDAPSRSLPHGSATAGKCSSSEVCQLRKRPIADSDPFTLKTRRWSSGHSIRHVQSSRSLQSSTSQRNYLQARIFNPSLNWQSSACSICCGLFVQLVVQQTNPQRTEAMQTHCKPTDLAM